MRTTCIRTFLLACALSALLMLSACAKKTAQAPPPPPPAPRPTVAAVTPTTVHRTTEVARPNDDLFNKGMKDVYFDYDKFAIRADQAPISQQDADYLRAHPEIKVIIEGHCDDRGSEEYNLGLGDNRASTLKAELVKMGISADRIKTLSYGKEQPFCSEDNEQCWQSNRRDHVVLQAAQ